MHLPAGSKVDFNTGWQPTGLLTEDEMINMNDMKMEELLESEECWRNNNGETGKSPPKKFLSFLRDSNSGS
mgnify:CR=1 FL=1